MNREYISEDGIGFDTAREIVREVRISDDDIVIKLPANIGSIPFFRYDPYMNSRGVGIDRWECLTIKTDRLPNKTYVRKTETVDVYESDDFPLRHLTSEWIVGYLSGSRMVELILQAETPFANFPSTVSYNGDSNG